jgi:hypothetical protein
MYFDEPAPALDVEPAKGIRVVATLSAATTALFWVPLIAAPVAAAAEHAARSLFL